MTVATTLELVVSAIEKVSDYINRSSTECSSQKKTLQLLYFIKEDLENGNAVRERLLRGFKDTCTTTAMFYEESSYALSIFDVKNALEGLYPKMKDLDLLRLDYGNGDPI